MVKRIKKRLTLAEKYIVLVTTVARLLLLPSSTKIKA